MLVGGRVGAVAGGGGEVEWELINVKIFCHISDWLRNENK